MQEGLKWVEASPWRERGSGGHRAPSVSGRSSLFNPWFVQVAHVSLSLCPHRQAHAGYHSSPLAHRIGRQHTSSCLIGRCDPCLIKTAAANHDMERTQEPSSAKDRLEIWLIQTDLKESGGIHRDLGWSVEDRILMEGGFRYELKSSRRDKGGGGDPACSTGVALTVCCTLVVISNGFVLMFYPLFVFMTTGWKKVVQINQKNTMFCGSWPCTKKKDITKWWNKMKRSRCTLPFFFCLQEM